MNLISLAITYSNFRSTEISLQLYFALSGQFRETGQNTVQVDTFYTRGTSAARAALLT